MCMNTSGEVLLYVTKVKNNENENTFFEIHYTLWLTTIQSQYLEYFEVVWPFIWNIPAEHEQTLHFVSFWERELKIPKRVWFRKIFMALANICKAFHFFRENIYHRYLRGSQIHLCNHQKCLVPWSVIFSLFFSFYLSLICDV